MNSKHFLITGGSGFLGINLIRHLLSKGHAIRSLDLLEFDYAEADQIEAIIGDIRNKETMDLVTKDIDIVIHCAAALPLYSPEEIYTTDVLGTRNVLEAAFNHKVERVVHISSTAVYGIPDHHPLLEDDELIGVGPYGEAKIEAEHVCLEYRKKGMCVPILRPKSFVGPERLGAFILLYDWAMSGKNFPILGNGKNRYQLLDVRDLDTVIETCSFINREVANDTFNIGAKEFTTMAEDFQAVLDTAGFKKNIIGLPAWPAIFTLRLLEFLHLSPLYKWIYETASKDSFVSIQKAEMQLHFKPQYSNKEALIENYQWYIKHLDSFSNLSGVTHRVPWKQGILQIAKMFF